MHNLRCPWGLVDYTLLHCPSSCFPDSSLCSLSCIFDYSTANRLTILAIRLGCKGHESIEQGAICKVSSIPDHDYPNGCAQLAHDRMSSRPLQAPLVCVCNSRCPHTSLRVSLQLSILASARLTGMPWV